MPRNPSRSPSVSWCFTWNNYPDGFEEEFEAKLRSNCAYFIYGREVGANGTRHLQGYLRLKASNTFQFVKSECLNSFCHVEKARGAAGVNRRYCSKDGVFVEYGKCPGVKDTKSRDELAKEFRRNLDEDRDSGLVNFADANPGVWYFSGHNLLRNYLRIVPACARPDIRVVWLWGPPGVGKSRRAHEELSGGYIKDPRTKWWNGYTLQREAIIDDFGPNGIDINHLLRWFDRYKCYVEVKGDMVPLCVEKFYVTSNFEPSECFKDKDGVVHPQMDALYRRIVVEHME